MDTTTEKLASVKEKMDLFFQKIGQLTRVQRLLICLVTFAIIGGAYYYFIYAPKQEELKRVEQTYTKKKNQLDNYKREAAKLVEFEKKMAQAQEKFNIAMASLPDKRELPSLLTGISKAGSDAGLTFLLFKPAGEVNKTFYKEIPVSIKVQGRYHQITDFFYQITRLNRIVNINNVNVKSKRGGRLLEMSCTAVTYMFVEQPKTQPAKGRKARNRKKR